MLGFFALFTAGALFGVAIMCVVQINKKDEEER